MVARRFDMRTRSSLQAPAGRGGASARNGRSRLRRLRGGHEAGPGRFRCAACCRRRHRADGGALDVALHHAAGVAAAAPSRCRRRSARRPSSRSASPAAWRCGPPPGLRWRPARRRRCRWCGRAPDDADSSMTPSTSPTLTSSPSLRSIRLNTPACGVPPRDRSCRSRARREDRRPRRPPSLRSHLATRASTIDSPTSIRRCLSWCSVSVASWAFPVANSQQTVRSFSLDY